MNTMRTVSENIAARVHVIGSAIKIEACEVWMSGLSLSWLLPLVVSIDALNTSKFYSMMAVWLPRPVMLCVVSVLLAWHVVGMILGGYPSSAIRHGEDERRWLLWRRTGMYLAMFFWIAVGMLLTQIALLPASIVYGVSGGLTGLWGVIRFRAKLEESKVLDARQQERHDLLQVLTTVTK